MSAPSVFLGLFTGLSLWAAAELLGPTVCKATETEHGHWRVEGGNCNAFIIKGPLPPPHDTAREKG